MTKEEWDALKGLADDRSIVIKKVNKGSCVVVWCRDDHIKEAKNQLKDNTIYKDVSFKETMLSDLVDKGNKSFKSLHSHKCITEKELYSKNSKNTFPINLKRQPTSTNYIFCQEFTSIFLMYLGDL